MFFYHDRMKIEIKIEETLEYFQAHEIKQCSPEHSMDKKEIKCEIR